MKRAYKLQEFVAHASDVNCLKIGKKTSRVLVTGGDDFKVNIWAIGKPNAILSLSGHTTGVESVAFDSSEAMVVAGAASGTIKLWDLEEAKIVRTLTGHRSNCISVDFHPFGEFFASGSSDTNFKIWDIRRKGCIHTYKGHTRGVKCVKFSPDGKWIVSGGEDNTVKLWDLTAGKLIHDFKNHEGQIQCLDFHPHEFLLASGSADKTVKFYDLETFELIASAGPETSGVRAMSFNPDGRSLVSATQDNMKVLSWEPLRYHDTVDVGWSKIADLSIHEGKLLGCSSNQSCVGVWVVDLTRATPLQTSSARSNGIVKAASNANPPVVESQPADVKPRTFYRARKEDDDVPPVVDSMRPSPLQVSSARSNGVLSGKVASNISAKTQHDQGHPIVVDVHPSEPRHRPMSATRARKEEEDVHPEPRHRPMSASRARKEEDVSVVLESGRSTPVLQGSYVRSNGVPAGKLASNSHAAAPDGDNDLRKSRSFSAYRARKEDDELPVTIHVGRRKTASFDRDISVTGADTDSLEKTASTSQNEAGALEELFQQHSMVTSVLQTRLAKLQMVRRLWAKNDLKAVIDATSKLHDNSVLGDFLHVLTERSDGITLELCSSLIPLANTLLNSNVDSHVSTSLSLISMLIRSFGSVIHNTLTATPTIGVDVQAEERHSRCSECFREFQAIKENVAPLVRKTGEVGKVARDINVALNEL